MHHHAWPILFKQTLVFTTLLRLKETKTPVQWVPVHLLPFPSASHLTLVWSLVIVRGPKQVKYYWLTYIAYADSLVFYLISMSVSHPHRTPRLLSGHHIAFSYHVFTANFGCDSFWEFYSFWWPWQFGGVLLRTLVWHPFIWTSLFFSPLNWGVWFCPSPFLISLCLDGISQCQQLPCPGRLLPAGFYCPSGFINKSSRLWPR